MQTTVEKDSDQRRISSEQLNELQAEFSKEPVFSPHPKIRPPRTFSRSIPIPDEIVLKLRKAIMENLDKVNPPAEVEPRTIPLSCPYCYTKPAEDFEYKGPGKKQIGPIRTKDEIRFRCIPCKGRTFSRRSSLEAHKALRAITVLVGYDLLSGSSLVQATQRHGISEWHVRLAFECVMKNLDIFKESQLELFQPIQDDYLWLYIDKSGSGVSKRDWLLSISDGTIGSVFPMRTSEQMMEMVTAVLCQKLQCETLELPQVLKRTNVGIVVDGEGTFVHKFLEAFPSILLVRQFHGAKNRGLIMLHWSDFTKQDNFSSCLLRWDMFNDDESWRDPTNDFAKLWLEKIKILPTKDSVILYNGVRFYPPQKRGVHLKMWNLVHKGSQSIQQLVDKTGLDEELLRLIIRSNPQYSIDELAMVTWHPLKDTEEKIKKKFQTATCLMPKGAIKISESEDPLLGTTIHWLNQGFDGKFITSNLAEIPFRFKGDIASYRSLGEDAARYIEIRSATKKLPRLLEKLDSLITLEVVESVILQPRTTKSKQKHRGHIKIQVRKAIRKGLPLVIRYVDRNGTETMREIKPYGFTRAQDKIKAFCYLRNEDRKFAIDRIENLAFTEDSLSFHSQHRTDMKVDIQGSSGTWRKTKYSGDQLEVFLFYGKLLEEGKIQSVHNAYTQFIDEWAAKFLDSCPSLSTFKEELTKIYGKKLWTHHRTTHPLHVRDFVVKSYQEGARKKELLNLIEEYCEKHSVRIPCRSTQLRWIDRPRNVTPEVYEIFSKVTSDSLSANAVLRLVKEECEKRNILSPSYTAVNHWKKGGCPNFLKKKTYNKAFSIFLSFYDTNKSLSDNHQYIKQKCQEIGITKIPPPSTIDRWARNK